MGLSHVPSCSSKTAALKKQEIIELKSEGLNNSQIAGKLKISRGSVISMLKGEVIPKGKKTALITLWLRVENNSKFVRGKKKVRERIEDQLLSDYQMKNPDGWEYELIFKYEDDQDLEKQVYDLAVEMEALADYKNCFIEADFYEKSTDHTF